jgi:capsular polysaccharide biosynthesis protein
VELRQYLSILRRRLALVVVTTLVGVLFGWLATPRVSSYSAQSTIYVGARQFGLSGAGVPSQDILQGVERIGQTYALMIMSQPIAQAALSRTGLQRSASSVVSATSAAILPNTQLLRVVVTDSDPVVAQELGNAVADAFVEKIQTFEPTAPAQEGSVPSLPAYVFERARLPTAPHSNGVGRNLFLGGFFGFLVAVGLSFVLEYLDITIKSPADAERRLELPVLAVIPYQYIEPIRP